MLKYLRSKVTYDRIKDEDKGGQIMSYDVEFLVSYGWALPFKGNIFTVSVFEGVAMSIAAATVLAIFKCKGTPNGRCIPLPVGVSNITLLTVTSFIIGLFSNTLLQRWWALRSHVQGHMGTNNDIIMHLASAIANNPRIASSEAECIRAKRACYSICRYLSLANHLVFMNANKKFDYQSLMNDELITRREYNALKETSGSANIPFYWIDAKVQKMVNAGWLGSAESSQLTSNLSIILSMISKSRSHCATVAMYVDTQLPYPFVQLVSFVVHACVIQVIFVAGGTIGYGIEEEEYGDLFTAYLTLILFISVLRSLLVLYDKLSNPLGQDVADFPYQAWLKSSENGMIAIMNNIFTISLPEKIMNAIDNLDFKSEGEHIDDDIGLYMTNYTKIPLTSQRTTPVPSQPADAVIRFADENIKPTDNGGVRDGEPVSFQSFAKRVQPL